MPSRGLSRYPTLRIGGLSGRPPASAKLPPPPSGICPHAELRKKKTKTAPFRGMHGGLPSRGLSRYSYATDRGAFELSQTAHAPPLLRLRLRHPLRGYPDTYDKDEDDKDEEEDYPLRTCRSSVTYCPNGHTSAQADTSIMHFALCIMH